jgi:hypothetical protein
VWHVLHKGEMRSAHGIPVEDKRKKPLRRPEVMSEDGMKNDIKELWFQRVNWIRVCKDRVQRRGVNTVVNFMVP